MKSTVSKSVQYNTFVDTDSGGISSVKIYVESTLTKNEDDGKSELASERAMSIAEESWLQDEKIPLYKKVGEFLVDSVSGYMLMYGAYSIIGSPQPTNEILTSIFLTAFPYFTTRVAGDLVSTWLSKSSTNVEDYKHLVTRTVGAMTAGTLGVVLGVSGAFKTVDVKDTAFLSMIGMFAGKTAEAISNNVSLSCESDFYKFRLNRK